METKTLNTHFRDPMQMTDAKDSGQLGPPTKHNLNNVSPIPLCDGVVPPGTKLQTTYISIDELKKLPDEEQDWLLDFWWWSHGCRLRKGDEVSRYYAERFFGKETT